MCSFYSFCKTPRGWVPCETYMHADMFSRIVNVRLSSESLQSVRATTRLSVTDAGRGARLRAAAAAGAEETFWLASRRAGAQPRDPLNNTVLSTTQVSMNWDKHREVNAWLQENPKYIPKSWASHEDLVPAEAHGGGRTLGGGAGRGTWWGSTWWTPTTATCTCSSTST